MLCALMLYVLAELVACASTTSALAPTQSLDPQTAATISVVSKPMVFARERSEVAANVRDYVTLSTVAVNRSGTVRYYWIAYFWSTLDARTSEAVQFSANGSPVLIADDRRITLGQRMSSADAAGISVQPHRPPGVLTVPMIYATTLETLRFVALSRQLRMLASEDPTELPYALWRDERSALAAMTIQMTQ